MTIKRLPLIAYACLMPLLLSLGVWQLNRADEKRVLLTLQSQHQSKETLLLDKELPDYSMELLYQPVRIAGHYDSQHQYLLDNQLYQGKAGYFVLTPLITKHANRAVLVNRGWVPAGTQRSELPAIAVEPGEVSLSGRINHFPSVGMLLKGAEIPSNTWPSVVQVINIDELVKTLGYPLVDFQIELDKTVAQGYIREWQRSPTMTPEKHLGYAVQWFLLAIALTLLFLKYGVKKDSS